MKENSAYGSVHPTAASIKLGEHEGARERKEAAHDYEAVSQL